MKTYSVDAIARLIFDTAESRELREYKKYTNNTEFTEGKKSLSLFTNSRVRYFHGRDNNTVECVTVTVIISKL